MGMRVRGGGLCSFLSLRVFLTLSEKCNRMLQDNIMRKCIPAYSCMCDGLITPDESTNLCLYNGSIMKIQMPYIS
jgi:hypothetical protein